MIRPTLSLLQDNAEGHAGRSCAKFLVWGLCIRELSILRGLAWVWAPLPTNEDFGLVTIPQERVPKYTPHLAKTQGYNSLNPPGNPSVQVTNGVLNKT